MVSSAFRLSKMPAIMTVENWTLPTRKWNKLHPPDSEYRALGVNMCAFVDQVIFFAFSWSKLVVRCQQVLGFSV
jgi:hypothetical protein